MPSEIKAYDLVIIGGGPAGIVGAATAKACHKTVALVDNHRELGGAGVNTGTVPSKTLRETALALSGIKARKLIGRGPFPEVRGDGRRFPPARAARQGRI